MPGSTPSRPRKFAMGITFTPLHQTIGAECSGVDIAEPLTPEQVATIDQGMDRYAVLVFRRKEPLTTEQQIAFTQNFGELEPPYTQIQSPDGKRLDSPHLADISNLGPGDRLLERDDRKRLFGLGNQLWHSDSSYKAIPARYSLLCAHVVPPEGGNTRARRENGSVIRCWPISRTSGAAIAFSTVTTAGACSGSATSCGAATAAIRQSRPGTRCYARMWSRDCLIA